MKVVLDTNVVVSGFLNPYGAPGTILQLVAEGGLILCYDARILAEYRGILLRPKFGLNTTAVDDFLYQIETEGLLATTRPLPKRLPDTTDEPFLETALAGEAAYLVTGNKRHFPSALCQGTSVILPKDFLEILRKKGQ